MVLVGCGGALPVLDFMDAEEDAVFYVIDRWVGGWVGTCVCKGLNVCMCSTVCSQRPLDLDNVYNQDQVGDAPSGRR